MLQIARDGGDRRAYQGLTSNHRVLACRVIRPLVDGEPGCQSREDSLKEKGIDLIFGRSSPRMRSEIVNHRPAVSSVVGFLAILLLPYGVIGNCAGMALQDKLTALSRHEPQ